MVKESGIELMLESALAWAGMEKLRAPERRRLCAYLSEVSSWGERMHLVGRGDFRTNLGTQLLDSLLLLAAAEREAAATLSLPNLKLADIGSGAGFPAICWKIVRPDMNVVLFERRLKPYAFLMRTIPLLGLSGLSAMDTDAAQAEAETFDIVTSKAAGRLDAILPVAQRLLVDGGIYVTIKGSSWRGEMKGGPFYSMVASCASTLPRGRGVALFFTKAGRRFT